MKHWEITEKGTLLLTEEESELKIELYLAINQKIQIFKAIERSIHTKKTNFNPVIK